MTTLVLQWLVLALRICFAALALLIARKLPAGHSAVERATWYVTGVVFATQAAIATVQAFFGSIAFVAGPESRWLAEYLRWAPAANHSRGILTYCLLACFIVLLVKGDRAARWHRSFYTFVAVSALFGAGLGLLEGSLVPGRHWANIAISEALTFVVLAAVLFAALLRPLMDRWMWASLGIYGFSGIFNSILIAGLAWAEIPESWAPAPWHLQAIRAVLAAAIVVIAAWRLRLAIRGIAVPNLLEAKRAAPVFHRL